MNAIERKQEKLADVKQQLSEKYFRLASASGSKPRKKTFLLKAENYRRQADVLRKALA